MVCSCFTTLAVGLATILLAVVAFFQWRYTYWRRRNFPHFPPSFPLGNAQGINTRFSLPFLMKNIYMGAKGERLMGVWLGPTPGLLIRDLELIKTILVKEFSSFHDRGFYANVKNDPLTGHLFFLRGQKWRNLRIKLAPTFTSGKMKMMFPTLVKCGEGLKQFLQAPAAKQETLNVKSVMASYTMDVIASVAFGLEINAFENPDNDFKKASEFLFKPSLFDSLKQILNVAVPKFAQKFNMKLVPQRVEDFFMAAVEDTFRERETKNIERKDFMQLLIQLKNKGRLEDSEVYSHGEMLADADYDPTFTTREAAAQAFVFFVAGFETSSTTLQFALYELALNHSVQDRLRAEIDESLKKNGGQLTYEGVQEMEYLDQVVSETLRKYPPAPLIPRECSKTFRVPDTDLVIEKDVRIFIPILGIHHDPEYYPQPERFDPDRFSAGEKEKRPQFAYIPFGEGPRLCIGMRFAQMQTKVGLAVFLANYKVDVSPRTRIPLEFTTNTILLAIKDDMDLKILNRDVV